MSDLLNNYPRLSRLQFVFSTIGDIFYKTVKFASIVKQYVYNEHHTDEEKGTDHSANHCGTDHSANTNPYGPQCR